MEQMFNKLVRDKIPEIIESNDEIPVIRFLDNDEYRSELYKKLFEEVSEVVNTSNKEDVLEELADVLEVLRAIANLEDMNINVIYLNIYSKKTSFFINAHLNQSLKSGFFLTRFN